MYLFSLYSLLENLFTCYGDIFPIDNFDPSNLATSTSQTGETHLERGLAAELGKVVIGPSDRRHRQADRHGSHADPLLLPAAVVIDAGGAHLFPVADLGHGHIPPRATAGPLLGVGLDDNDGGAVVGAGALEGLFEVADALDGLGDGAQPFGVLGIRGSSAVRDSVRRWARG